jgi:hypothetical protein
LLWQLARRAFSRARAKTGNKMAAKMAMMAMTTKSSINVNPLRFILGFYKTQKIMDDKIVM